MAKWRALAAAAALAAGLAAAEEGHFPVWIAPSVGAATPAEAAAMLTRRFTSSEELRSGPELAMPGNSDVREVWTCEALETARREGYRGTWRSSLERVDARCQILRLAARGKPAKTSYLRDFHLDRIAPTFLPAAFGSPWGCQSREVHIHANARGIPWTEIEERYFALVDEILQDGRGPVRAWPAASNYIRVDEIEDSNPDDDVYEQYFEPYHNDQLVIEADNPNLQSTRSSIFTNQAPAMGPDRMKVYTYLIQTMLEIVGRGDFNDDGFDDVIVWFERNTVRDVPIYREGVYLLTREAPDAVLRLVDAPFTLLARHCPESYERITGKPSPYK